MIPSRLALTRDQRGAILALCRDLVRTPSVNGVHPEQEVARVVADFAEDHDLGVEIVACEPSRPNVLIGTSPDEPPDLILLAHMDTVPAGDEAQWSRDPFAADMIGGRVYGRGSADNKGGLAAALGALLCLNSGIDEAASVLVVCVSDEESGATGELGVKHVLANRPLNSAGAIYTYPGMHRVVVGHRGVMRFALRVSGRAIHSGSAAWRHGTAGASAIDGAIAVVETMRAAVDEGPGSSRPVVLTPTLIEGGFDAGVVPDRCDVTIDIRYAGGMDVADIEQRLRHACDTVVWSGTRLGYVLERTIHVPPTQIAGNSGVVAAVRDAVRAVAGRDVPTVISGPANESYILNDAGIPTCVLGPRGGRVHAPDEYVVVESIFTAAAVYAQSAVNLRKARSQLQ